MDLDPYDSRAAAKLPVCHRPWTLGAGILFRQLSRTPTTKTHTPSGNLVVSGGSYRQHHVAAHVADAKKPPVTKAPPPAASVTPGAPSGEVRRELAICRDLAVEHAARQRGEARNHDRRVQPDLRRRHHPQRHQRRGVEPPGLSARKKSDPLVRINLYGEVKISIHVPVAAEPARPKTRTAMLTLHIIDPTGQFVDELYHVHRRPDGHLVADVYSRNDLRGPGVGKGGVRAYGGSAIAGLIRTGELRSGIRHVLAVALPRRPSGSGLVWPATAEMTSPRRSTAAASRWASCSPCPATSTPARSNWAPGKSAAARPAGLRSL